MPLITGVSIPHILAGAFAVVGLVSCSASGRRVKMVYPQKTTYVDAAALDGGAVEVPPRVLEMVHPAYPRDAGPGGADAFAIVEFNIDAKGRVKEARIKESSAAILDAPALEAIAAWSFDPATREGEPILVLATVRLTFDLP